MKRTPSTSSLETAPLLVNPHAAAAVPQQHNPNLAPAPRGEFEPVSPTSAASAIFAPAMLTNGDGAAGAHKDAALSATSAVELPARSASGQGFRIRIDRPSTPSLTTTALLSSQEPPTPTELFPALDPYGEPTLLSRLTLLAKQTASNALSTFFLAFVVVWALASQAVRSAWRWAWYGPRRGPRRAWDDAEKWKGEEITRDPKYYARECGFELGEEVVESADGYLLRMHRVIHPPSARTHADGRGGFPVLILHGLFQSSGSFITSEERSLAFWLAEHGGYQVFLGNTRGVFDMGHKRFKRSDPRFWDYTIKELALYDLPALVDYIRKTTGYDKIGFIGHSQGNGLAFISLSLGMRPELGEKLSVFVALAPAVFAGPLTTGFPFTTLGRMEWKTWRRVFGVLDFIPIMTWAYNYTPKRAFALLGYQMFAFLFSWTDKNWLKRRKAKMFRFTPSPVSSKSIFWWAGKGGFAQRGCTLDPAQPKWFDARTFPPLSIWAGDMDYLVLLEPLLERLREHERDVRVLRVERLETGEHCDFFWAADAVEWCYEAILDDIEKTRERYPEEEEANVPPAKVPLPSPPSLLPPKLMVDL